jgi:hypothetical protein
LRRWAARGAWILGRMLCDHTLAPAVCSCEAVRVRACAGAACGARRAARRGRLLFSCICWVRL